MTKQRNNPVALARASFLALALICAPAAFAGAGAASTSQVSVLIRPAISLQQLNDTVRLRIRLAPDATATVWTADDSCSAPSSSARAISRSGTYDFPASDLGAGNRVCVASSDGSLRLSDLRSSTSTGRSF